MDNEQEFGIMLNNLTDGAVTWKITPHDGEAIAGDSGPLSYGTVSLPFAPSYEICFRDAPAEPVCAEIDAPSVAASFTGSAVIVTFPI